MEGFWSLLRSWLRPHRGIAQEKLPLYLGFFAFVHNVRKRGKALLGALMELLVTEDPGIPYERCSMRRRAHEADYALAPIVPGLCLHTDNGDRRVRCPRCSS